MTITETTEDAEKAQLLEEQKVLSDRFADVINAIDELDERRRHLVFERDNLIGTLNSEPYYVTMRAISDLTKATPDAKPRLTFQAVSLISRAWRGAGISSTPRGR